MTGRTALVTGGGRGIGRGCARALGAAGARVAVAARTAREVEAVAAEIRAAGGEAWPCACDVTDAASVRGALDGCEARLGPCDTVVHAAGIAESAPLAKTSDDLWQRMLDVNLTGTFHVLREALPRMAARRFGRVVVLASVAGKAGAPYIAAYVASKHGVLGLVRAAASEYATQGVTVNAVCPGYVDTPMTDAAVARIVATTKRSAADARAVLEHMSPQRRLITVDEVAHVVGALVARAAGSVNGQAWNVDGGAVQS